MLDLPPQAKKYFWGDDLQQLNWPEHKKYITQTLLDKGDEISVSWLINKVGYQELAKMLSSLKLSSKSKNFWQLYLN